MSNPLSASKASDLRQSHAFTQTVVESALWAAAGDALGWITELSHGPAGVKNRTGSTEVKQPVAWQRLIAGRNGPKVALPAGTYSDDTQLRLAVSRSIRGNGVFDVETFAKIELPVWPTYALGAGLGTKAAALNLSRRGVNWFSNFYVKGAQSYIQSGGNGAAMRIQPHVWSSKGDDQEMLLNVFRDAITTHGHPHGFCGAVFHALVLKETLQEGSIPGPSSWKEIAQQFLELPKIIREDSQLVDFWLASWERETKNTLEEAMSRFCGEALHDISRVSEAINDNPVAAYKSAISSIGCLTDRFRGSGFKTALAASVLSYLYRSEPIEEALVLSANVLESDTDTIATMAGALLGAIAGRSPIWNIQDSDYIISDATRLANIAIGNPQSSFSYPDIGRWNPPVNQGASIRVYEDRLAIAGLGALETYGDEYSFGDHVWQWSTLPFGQTILAKRKAFINDVVGIDQLPKPSTSSNMSPSRSAPDSQFNVQQPELNFELGNTQSAQEKPCEDVFLNDLDAESDIIISSNFDSHTIGKIFKIRIDATSSIESAMTLLAIVAKARIARNKRRK
ncbi:ADP-ribosylglycohydrolase family protein [Pseudomonas syringae group genomosp. 3]|uniref:Putative ADP-ribosylglycohydrolase n=1 Tax=Pseudomonas syringae pv. viburni TaxID=251703 RepID=A0A0Q0DLJ7_9PSED|nr:ADP-ribosylglycohydrolase family protein [Pseudomonas syringae group genomosp. 3]KPZ08558.1 putative ADP-ribosylglycohydrolase [Pseudomonas syringae pv. viburni]